MADAAIRVVAEHGLDQLSVRTVAREAHVAPGTVQHHFPSRALLLERTGPNTSGLTALRKGLRALLPVDRARREEAIV